MCDMCYTLSVFPAVPGVKVEGRVCLDSCRMAYIVLLPDSWIRFIRTLAEQMDGTYSVTNANGTRKIRKLRYKALLSQALLIPWFRLLKEASGFK